MSRKTISVLAAILILIVIVAITSIGGYPSAYGACRDKAMHTKGYYTWMRQTETDAEFRADVSFSDGVNDMDCQAVRIGFLWHAVQSFSTLVGVVCPSDANQNLCPKWDYHGVIP